MKLLHVYLKLGSNIIGTIGFKISDDSPPNNIEAREIVLPVTDEETLESIKQQLVELLDKEKQDNGKHTDGQSGMVPCITIN